MSPQSVIFVLEIVALLYNLQLQHKTYPSTHFNSRFQDRYRHIVKGLLFVHVPLQCLYYCL